MGKSDMPLAVQNSCFFGYLDILGFKNIVKQSSFDKLKSIVEDFTANCAKAIDKSRCIETYTGGVISRIKIGPNIHARIVSDSIFVWTEKDDRLQQFKDLLHIVNTLVASGFQRGLPLRGVVTFGELFIGNVKIPEDIPSDFSFDNGSVYGKALVEAYELESRMEWSGVLLTPKAWAKVVGEFERCKTRGMKAIMGSGGFELPSDLFNHFPYLLWYKVPFKNDKSQNAIAFNWNYPPCHELSEEMIRNAFTKRCGGIVDSIKGKLDETIRFFKYTQRAAELCNLGLRNVLPVPDSDYVLWDIGEAIKAARKN